MSGIESLDDLDEGGLGELFRQMQMEDFIKASFGGDRSAAGRYAAQQRWKNHKKSEKDKKSVSLAAVAERINNATAYIDTAGMEIQHFRNNTQGFDRSVEISRKRANKTFEKILSLQYPDKRNPNKVYSDSDPREPLPEKFRLGALMIEKALNPSNTTDGVIVVGEDKINSDLVVAGAASYRLFQTQSKGAVLVFDYAGSYGVIRGVGSALLGRVTQIASSKNAELILGSLKGAVSFWEEQGFKNDGWNEERGVYNMKLTREQVHELAGLLDD